MSKLSQTFQSRTNRLYSAKSYGLVIYLINWIKDWIMTRDDLPPPSERYWEKWHISKDQYDQYIVAKKNRDKNVPEIGTIAPDFTIEKLDRAGRRTGEMFQLSSTRGKPVALVFGSYT